MSRLKHYTREEYLSEKSRRVEAFEKKLDAQFEQSMQDFTSEERIKLQSIILDSKLEQSEKDMLFLKLNNLSIRLKECKK